MAMLQQFSKRKGKNITLSDGDRQVSWTVNDHTGLCVLDKALDVGDYINLVVDGESYRGGHVYVGLTSSSDKDLKNNNKKGKRVSELCAPATQIRVKGNKVWYKLEKKTEKCFEIQHQGRGGEKKTIETSRGKKYRLAAEIMFGKLAVHIERSSRNFFWDPVLCGDNVFVTRNGMSASLIESNPQANCALETALSSDSMVKLELATDRDVCYWHVLLFISSVPPSKSQIECANFSYTDASEFYPLLKLKNPMKYLLLWYVGGELSCQTEGGGSPHTCHIPLCTDDKVYVYFELQRLSMKVVPVSDDEREKEVIYGSDYGYCLPHIYEEIPYTQTPCIYSKPSSIPVEHDEEKCETMLGNLERDLIKNKRKATDGKKYQIQKFLNQTYQALSENGSLGARYAALSPRSGEIGQGSSKPLPELPSRGERGGGSVRYRGMKLPEVYLNKKVDGLVGQISELKKMVKEVEKKRKCSIVTRVKMDWL